jgi:hypothetical protein
VKTLLYVGARPQFVKVGASKEKFRSTFNNQASFNEDNFTGRKSE